MESLIDDVALLERIAELSTVADDPTGNWIGGGRPKTNHRGPVGGAGIHAENFARWSAIHYWFYEALVMLDPEPEKRALAAVDLGCAGGARTVQLAEYYGSVLGIDRSAKCIDFARLFNRGSGVPRVLYNCADWPCKAYRPDRIFAVEFFEHSAPGDQARWVKAALGALTPGGLLLMTMPNEAPQGPPHQGTLLDAGFDALLAGTGARVAQRGHFDNEAPGDPCRDGWSPIGPKPSHHYAVLEV